MDMEKLINVLLTTAAYHEAIEPPVEVSVPLLIASPASTLIDPRCVRFPRDGRCRATSRLRPLPGLCHTKEQAVSPTFDDKQVPLARTAKEPTRFEDVNATVPSKVVGDVSLLACQPLRVPVSMAAAVLPSRDDQRVTGASDRPLYMAFAEISTLLLWKEIQAVGRVAS